jgi:hypothetical protein
MVLGQKATVTQIDRAAFGDGDRRVALLIGPAEQRRRWSRRCVGPRSC